LICQTFCFPFIHIGMICIVFSCNSKIICFLSSKFPFNKCDVKINGHFYSFNSITNQNIKHVFTQDSSFLSLQHQKSSNLLVYIIQKLNPKEIFKSKCFEILSKSKQTNASPLDQYIHCYHSNLSLENKEIVLKLSIFRWGLINFSRLWNWEKILKSDSKKLVNHSLNAKWELEDLHTFCFQQHFDYKFYAISFFWKFEDFHVYWKSSLLSRKDPPFINSPMNQMFAIELDITSQFEKLTSIIEAKLIWRNNAESTLANRKCKFLCYIIENLF
jgi:hypothetical protein